MESSRILLKLYNFVLPFRDTLYLLQQEEYSLQRFNFWFFRFFLRRNVEHRDTLKYTQRVRITYALAVLLWVIGLLLLSSFGIGLVITIVFIGLWCILIPCTVLLANALTAPFYQIIKTKIISRAEKQFQEKRGTTKVVAIAGSYGKTTIKNFIEQLLRYDLKVQMVPGNINSTIGIAQWILRHFYKGTDVLVLEVDAYAKGRIARTCKLVNPDVVILSNIGDQHVVRFGTKKKLAESLSEILLYPGTDLKLTTHETLLTLKKYGITPENVNTLILEETGTQLSESNKTNLSFALTVADYFHIPEDHKNHILKTVVVPDRRQSKTILFGYEALDDSYNISFTTAQAGIDEAFDQAKKVGKKLVVITGGIPELGQEDKDKNIRLGEYLNKKADSIIILNTIFAKEINEGIGTPQKSVTVENLTAAVSEMNKDYDINEWFLLLQPELTDLYY
jgi:UDP-N-acetylmuramoyl-tripeptide--D-alanyl-D-alanine ligase